MIKLRNKIGAEFFAPMHSKSSELSMPKLQAFTTAMEIFTLSKTFPKEETYSLTDQIRRSSRSVCANLAEAWRKRRYAASFISTWDSRLEIKPQESLSSTAFLPIAVSSSVLGIAQTSQPHVRRNKIASARPV